MLRVLGTTVLISLLAACSTHPTSPAATYIEDDAATVAATWPDPSKRQELDASDGAALKAIAAALKPHSDVASAYFLKIPKQDGGYRYVLVPVFDGEPSVGALGDAMSAFSQTNPGQRLELLLLTPAAREQQLSGVTPIYSRL